MTIGHNPYKLSLTKFGVFLKGNRKKYLCEHLLEKYVGYNGEGRSSGALLGEYANLQKDETHIMESKIVKYFQAEHRTLQHRMAHAHSTRTLLGKVGVRGSFVMQRDEEFLGQKLLQSAVEDDPFSQMKLVDQQTLSMRLYESRIASLQRAVAFFVMFHQMGKDVQVAC